MRRSHRAPHLASLPVGRKLQTWQYASRQTRLAYAQHRVHLGRHACLLQHFALGRLCQVLAWP